MQTQSPSETGESRRADLASGLEVLESVIEKSGLSPAYRERLVDVVRRASTFQEDLDPASFGRSLIRAAWSVAREPGRLKEPVKAFSGLSATALRASFLRLLGSEAEGPLEPERGDKRFGDPDFRENTYFHLCLQAYLILSKLLTDLVDAAELSDVEREKASFALEMILDALSPTNFLFSHPRAMRLAFDTRGKSVVKGIGNLIRDVKTNRGWPSKVDASSFEVGKNMAVTPGKVVFRSELMELIQYAPQTEKVHARPIVLSPAWINKYYIMDLAPGKSFIEWAVTHGHTVFVISYRNPTAEMKDVSFTDYLVDGPVTAIRVARSITGADKVNVVGVCMGGTLTMATLAYLDAVGEDWVQSATLLNSHTDFTEPGLLGVFFDEHTVRSIDRKTERQGYLEASALTSTFDRLRSKDLVWRYVTNGWLMGESPPAFDLLAWNGDATNLPARMQSEYLQGCYVNNALARDELELGGERLEVSKVDEDLYVLAAIGDHIVPWISSYKTGGLVKGDVRFILSSSGHIAGMVNPPNPKASFWTNDARPDDPQDWLEGAEKVRDTWWNDWASWIAERGGAMQDPPPMGGEEYPPIEDAPGSYVRAKP